MGIPEKIDEIIEHRKQKLPQLDEAIEKIKNIDDVVSQLDKIRDSVDDNSNDNKYGIFLNEHVDLAEKLKLHSTAEFHKKYQKIMQNLLDLKNRYARENIHISLVGRAGMGKSLVLQNISGLGNEVIPSSTGSSCTGAKSIISNTNSDTVAAEITFYTVSEVLAIVNQYLSIVFKSDEFKVNTINDIKNLKNKNLKNKLDPNNGTEKYEHLENYIEHINEIEDKLGTVCLITAGEIESYVAQYSHDDPNLQFYSYLGVKQANILCRFPVPECGKIVLVDTIGLGDTSLGVREKMLCTAKDESDIIIYMFRPEALRSEINQFDLDIISSIREKLSPELASKMLCFVVNRVESGPATNISQVPKILKWLRSFAEESSIAQFMNVNCANKKDVEENLLNPILKMLADNLEDTDLFMAEKINGDLEKLYDEYLQISRNIEKAMVTTINSDIRRAMAGNITSCYKNMTNALRNLYVSDPFGTNRRKECAELKEAVQGKLKKILTYSPTIDEVMALLNDGTINQHNAYEILTNRLRLSIINDFLALDSVLSDLTNKMKSRVVHVLSDDTTGKLGAIIRSDPRNPGLWLNMFLQKIENNCQFNDIYHATEVLGKFEMRMDNFLIYEVRNCLDVIDISLMESTPQIRGSMSDKNTMADDIVFWLNHYIEIVYNNITEAMKNRYDFPNTAMFAVVKDFYDRITYSDNKISSETAWRYLYEDSISEIWNNEYTKRQLNQESAEAWNEFITQIQACSSKECFTISLNMEI